ncbi:uncharacterized protein LOC129581196 [Paramacrobiotus metropolitanus]|uniref:uncharacterized protein LOC129581196 n=1 Tax=Paramacrobiotus metropolitanus TaxID=2943436 RepID=UPI002445E8CC|nr:uncharacterized protein LOC129581196 [Paramacrobiotus metropolitanus]
MITNAAETNNIDPFTICAEPRPIEINCSSGRLTMSQPDLQRAEDTTVVFRIDRSFACVYKLYNLHMVVLELSNLTQQKDIEQDQQEVISAECSNGVYTLSSTDPENSHANRLDFRSDLSSQCFTKFTEVLDYIHNDLAAAHNTSSATAASTGLALPNEMWRTCGDIVVANCSEGTFIFSRTQNATTQSDGVVILIDHTFECRSTLVAIHEHILAQDMTTVQLPTAPLLKSITVH